MMSPERHEQIKKLFLAACELDPAARTAFLDQACKEDPSLREEVESLLRHHVAETIIDPQAAQPNVRRIQVVHDTTKGVPAAQGQSPSETTESSSASTADVSYPSSRTPSPPRGLPVETQPPAQERFIAGTIIAERYRIVTLLGKGGMGEVYRAEDLKLGRTVALKFLTGGRGHDPAWLARFYNEARIALTITNPHICRVYDLGDADGEAFISMEYIDGEDLASLLKRIGRLPQDKAVEIARQICYGLASAHAQGVLHRDLKPANIMLDGRGNVRITDFGIAALTSSGSDRFLPAGTPGYMAPELSGGRPATVSTDIYSLGLILYEMVTGRRAFDKANFSLQQRRDKLVPPSQHTQGLDPALENIILLCLEDSPADRPSSVYAVLADLPGGDPLSAALAAGEIPSPTILIRASSAKPTRPVVAFTWLFAAVLGLAASILLTEKTSFFVRAGLTKSPDVLEDAARHVLDVLGPKSPSTPISGSFVIDPNGLDLLRACVSKPADLVARQSGETAIVYFDCIIGAPHRKLLSVFPELRTVEPPSPDAASTTLCLDPQGRLIEYIAAPETVPTSEPTSPEWPTAVALAGLNPKRLKSVPPLRAPPVYADQNLAWETPVTHGTARVAAASVGNQLVYFRVWMPWELDTAHAAGTQSSRAMAGNLYAALFFVTLAVSLVLAWCNIRVGRCDRRGAWRLAVIVSALELLLWFVRQREGTNAAFSSLSMLDAFRIVVFTGFTAWVYYLALEPAVRRFWPHSIISWSRLLVGQWRDDLVGRDLLIGATFGFAVVLLQQLNALLPIWTGNPSPLLFLPGNEYDLGKLIGFRYGLETVTEVLLVAIGRGMTLIMLMLLLRMILRVSWLTGLGFLVVATTLYALNTDANSLLAWAMCAIVCGAAAIVLLRAGLLATVVSLFVTRLLVTTPITTDAHVWYSGMSGFTLFILAALLVLGLYAALGGRLGPALTRR